MVLVKSEPGTEKSFYLLLDSYLREVGAWGKDIILCIMIGVKDLGWAVLVLFKKLLFFGNLVIFLQEQDYSCLGCDTYVENTKVCFLLARSLPLLLSVGEIGIISALMKKSVSCTLPLFF